MWRLHTRDAAAPSRSWLLLASLSVFLRIFHLSRGLRSLLDSRSGPGVAEMHCTREGCSSAYEELSPCGSCGRIREQHAPSRPEAIRDIAEAQCRTKPIRHDRSRSRILISLPVFRILGRRTDHHFRTVVESEERSRPRLEPVESAADPIQR